VERSPIARINLSDEGCLLIGEGGVIVDDVCTSADSTVELVGAELVGEEAGGRLADERVTQLIEALRVLSIPELSIRQVDVIDLSSVVLSDASGLRVVLGAIESHVQRVEALVALSRSIDLTMYSSIDLRLEGEATLVTW